MGAGDRGKVGHPETGSSLFREGQPKRLLRSSPAQQGNYAEVGGGTRIGSARGAGGAPVRTPFSLGREAHRVSQKRKLHTLSVKEEVLS